MFNSYISACVKITVDGGTNHWLDYIGDSEAKLLLTGRSKKYLPTMVTGDMDSILPGHLESLKCLDVKVIYTVDQSATDFTKSIDELGQYLTKNNISVSVESFI